MIDEKKLLKDLENYKNSQRPYPDDSDNIMYFQVKDIINTQPKLNNGWIPCSEKLPEYTDDYNVTVGMASVDGYYEEVTVLRFECFKGCEPKWCITTTLGMNDYISRVIAWQPLPEKYREVSE